MHSIEGPVTSGDSAAHLITARFCSVIDSTAAVARQLVDLPSGGRGKLKVVALDPSDPDSTAVLESNEVTFNGGVPDEFAPAVLRVTSRHQSLQLEVTAIGSGLDGANSLAVAAVDASWTLPLVISHREPYSMTGAASVAALLPACRAIVGSGDGGTAEAALHADAEPELLNPQSCQAQYKENLLSPSPPPLGYTIQPKDFAFAKGFVDQTSNRFALHLFYIRHNYWYYQGPSSNWMPDLDEKNIGHIWTTDFNSWYGPAGLNKPDTVALAVRTGKFDDLHVWAPSIIQQGPIFRMFYTGVKDEPAGDHQRIGIATSTDLVTWVQADDPVLTVPEVPWAKKDLTGQPYSGSQQLRDPFVMENPISPGGWLMYFVAVDSLNFPKLAVGVARSADLVEWTADPAPFLGTEEPTSLGLTTIVESPHVFSRNGQWWLPYTVGGVKVVFETSPSADPSDANPVSWTSPIGLQEVAEGEPALLDYWHATEYLRINSKEYLAAFNDNDISIDITQIYMPANPAVDSLLLSCPQIAGAEPGVRLPRSVQLRVLRAGLRSSEVRLRISLPSRTPVRLDALDVAGRRCATILEGELPAGDREVVWDGRSAEGSRLRSGVYFLRLVHGDGTLVSKLVMLE